MKKNIIISFLLSMLVFLLSSWTAGYSLYAAAWSESVLYFVLTYLLLNKYVKSDNFGIHIVGAILFGRIVFELPVRIFEFRETLFSLFIPMVVIISIILASAYYREKRPVVLVLSVVIIILLNTVIHEDWINCFYHH